MRTTTPGLVLREVKFRESDRMLTILTPQGVVSASAKGSLRLKSKLFSACGLFCYSDFTFFEGRSGSYSVDEAQVKEVFFGLRSSVEGLALAMYLAELAATLQPTGAEAAGILRLLLNTLYLLSETKKDPRQIRAVAELRLLSLAGYMPNIVMCADCGRYEGGGFHLDVQGGQLLCADCAAAKGLQPNLNAAALAALRHVLLSEDKLLPKYNPAPRAITMTAISAISFVFTMLFFLLATLFSSPIKNSPFLSTQQSLKTVCNFHEFIVPPHPRKILKLTIDNEAIYCIIVLSS